MSDAEAQAFETVVKWLKDRQRAECTLTIAPVKGFGVPAGVPDSIGTMTLWLPQPEAGSGVAFKDGRAVRQNTEGCFSVPEIAQLRDQVLASIGGTAAEGITVDVAFIDYAAALIRAVYRVTDDDLGRLLSGERWHDPIMRHLMGGDDLISRLMKVAPDLTTRLLQPHVPAHLPLPADPEPLAPPAARRRWWSFLSRGTRQR